MMHVRDLTKARLYYTQLERAGFADVHKRTTSAPVGECVNATIH